MEFISIIAGILLPSLVDEFNPFNITPQKLAGYLEEGLVDKFNDARNLYKQEIVFDKIDLSYKNLTGINLNSIKIMNSNFFNTLMDHSTLSHVDISGNLSHLKMRHADINSTTIRDSDLSFANLSDSMLWSTV